jgi:hypothetical protein
MAGLDMIYLQHLTSFTVILHNEYLFMMEVIMQRLTIIRWLIALIALIGVSIAPAFAQDDTQDDPFADLLIFVRGHIEFISTGDTEYIIVDGVVIAPAGAFIPADLTIGQEVVVVGYLLNDDTLFAIELIIVDENFDECGEYGTGEGCDDVPEPEITPEPTETPQPIGCVPNTHPVANAIADEFGVDVAYVVELHCMGYGFGNIARAFMLYYDNGFGDSVEALLAQGAAGGWGAVLRQSGVHPSQLAPGRVINGRRGAQTTDEQTTTQAESIREANTNRGNNNANNGNGRGNGNNGNGNGRGNGNNDNGNGRGNGNNGNGGGRGRP